MKLLSGPERCLDERPLGNSWWSWLGIGCRLEANGPILNPATTDNCIMRLPCKYRVPPRSTANHSRDKECFSWTHCNFCFLKGVWALYFFWFSELMKAGILRDNIDQHWFQSGSLELYRRYCVQRTKSGLSGGVNFGVDNVGGVQAPVDKNVAPVSPELARAVQPHQRRRLVVWLLVRVPRSPSPDAAERRRSHVHQWPLVVVQGGHLSRHRLVGRGNVAALRRHPVGATTLLQDLGQNRSRRSGKSARTGRTSLE